MLQIWYDDYEITQHFIVRAIKPTLSAPVHNNYMSLPHLNGANFKFSSLGQIELKMEITIKHDIRHHLDELNKVLYTKEPKSLVISDQADRFLMCKLEGKVDFSSRFIASDATMTFVSPNHYWQATTGPKTFAMQPNGRIEVNNNGSAPTLPQVDVTFDSDCGYFGLVSPNGFITIGNPKELDKIETPKSEFALNEEMHNTTGWTKVSDIENWVPDYNKITSKGSAQHDEWGMQVNKSTFTGLSDNWQGHAYVKPFNQGAIDQVANNFKLRSRVMMTDLSSNRNSTAGMLLVVLDEHNTPIMTTSIYDSTSDTKKLATSFKINSFKDSAPKHSTIIDTDSISALNGWVEMRKSGNKFDWIIHTDSVNATPVPLKVGDSVHLKPTATKAATGHYYRNDYKGRTYKITAINNWPGHSKKIYHLSIGAHVIYHVYADDILEHNQTTTKTQKKQITHTITDNSLAQLRPAKLLVWQGVWGNTQPYSRFSLDSAVINRIYTTNHLDIENVFQKGDTLHINHKTEDILHNGTTIQALVDYDSRFFEIDWGDTEIEVVKSDWAEYPDVKLHIEERFL